MASVRSRCVNAAIRLFTRLSCKPGTTVEKFRQMLVKPDQKKRGKLSTGISIENIDKPFAARWLRNAVSSSDSVILYLHGGAFILRMPETYTEMVSRLCVRLGVEALIPWYRLAPEHPFPAAIDDCLTAYEYLLEKHSPANIIVMGDSAGASLTLSLLNLIKQRGLPQPKAAVTLSPITDFAQISSTWLMHKQIDPMFPMQRYVAPQLHYLQGKNILNPIASPIYGELSGLPPILMVVGGIEALRDDAVAYARQAIHAGVNAQVHIWQGMPHVHTLIDVLPEQALAETEITAWLNHLNETSYQEGHWSKAVVLYDRSPVFGHLSKISNGDQVSVPLQDAGLSIAEAS